MKYDILFDNAAVDFKCLKQQATVPSRICWELLLFGRITSWWYVSDWWVDTIFSFLQCMSMVMHVFFPCKNLNDWWDIYLIDMLLFSLTGLSWLLVRFGESTFLLFLYQWKFLFYGRYKFKIRLDFKFENSFLLLQVTSYL